MEKRLGKGLEALIPQDVSKGKERVERLRLKDIVPNPFQPRKKFGTLKMEELVNSMKEKGVIQPILVRPSGDRYELIAGERRWRAAQELNLEEIPAIIKNDIDNANSLEISLIENIQREELNPVEEANAYHELIKQFEYTLEKVGQIMGKDKTTISNFLRLLSLPAEIRDYLEDGKLSTGHAKAILSLTNDERKKKIAKTIIKHGLSVRQTEELVKNWTERKQKMHVAKEPEVARIEEELQHYLGTKVEIKHGKKRGKIEIQYFSQEDLDRLLRTIMKTV
ncbi:MAG: ParB/RepB/Spo0J family partition protein [Candidatus Omnitrophota bacterium]